MIPRRAVLADITTLAVDAIVNAANSSLLGGGGDSRRHPPGGRPPTARRVPLAGCPTGEARLLAATARRPATSSTPSVWFAWGGRAGEAELLAACYRNALQLAHRHGLMSLAFRRSAPASTATPDAAARIAVDTVTTWQAAAHLGK